jgi:hypothetical protein
MMVTLATAAAATLMAVWFLVHVIAVRQALLPDAAEA